VADFSGSMDFGAATQSKRELALDFCAAAALLAVKNNDRVGLLVYTDRVERFVPPRKGRRHVMRLLMELAGLRPEGRGTDPAPAAGYLMRTVKTRATVFWLSDFIGTADRGAVKAASARHELVPVLLADRLETGIPPVGLVELTDPETGARLLVDSSSPGFAASLMDAVSERDAGREALFKGLKAEPLRLWTGVSPIMPLTRYFRRKARLGRR
jgi:uncharacterized protein (DUF58 family)